ncbi:hypothetical protein Q8A67_017822 [Cirrhinus molitorella]|uniref:Uncharacterized protein n=1 Tax=Cirrhinus molitorella TaxID=172907 RepID=A0AA88TKA9_9TELE|nr:hypothetical protein Q8A67_017822 [Cirrhinus molitorella]
MLRSGHILAKNLTPSLRSSKQGPSMDIELIHVLSKALEDLDWSASEKPTHGCLDEWHLNKSRPEVHNKLTRTILDLTTSGTCKDGLNKSHPEVHNELTRTRRASYSACVHSSTSSAFLSKRQSLHIECPCSTT